MPDRSPDEEFSDLFAQLPDPRAKSSAPEDTSAAAAPAPGSRRAARQAAERATTAETTAVGETATTGELVTIGAPETAASHDSADLLVGAAAGRRSASTRPAASARSSRTNSEDDPLDDLFQGSAAPDRTEKAARTQKRTRRLGIWIVLGLILVLLVGVAAGGLYVWTTYEQQIREVMGWLPPADYEEGEATGEALVTIASGDNPSIISQSLYDAGVTRTADAFYDMLIDTEQNPTFYPGVYRLQQRMTSVAALAALQDPANRQENSALLREGETLEQILPQLAEGIGLPVEDFQAAVADPAVYGVAASTLEGWLFPALYEFDPGVTAQQVIQTMVDRTRQSLAAAGVPDADAERVLTIASIIQREGRTDDFPKVSRVIQNRLDQGMMLQMDSTAQYGYGELHEGSASTSDEAQYDDNPWNTYVIAGLPVGPISNAGDAAIDAAMHPADGDWLYFVTVNLDTGETVFTTNIDDHEAAVAQWRQWCTDNPDSGC